VQTFLPYADLAESAAALDDRRLGRQRVEALQVLRALTRSPYGWEHHRRDPAHYAERFADAAPELPYFWPTASAPGPDPRTADERSR
jgi:hypothetical protein